MSGIDCEACGRKSQTYLCSTCQSDLGDMLHGLAGRTSTNIVTGYSREASGWIEMLQDAAWGRTRLGESARRSSDKGGPAPVHLTDNKEDSFKGSPSELLGNIHTMLLKWVEVVNVGTETLTVPGEMP